MAVHVPVLLEPVLDYLSPAAGEGLLVDATVGEGGHAEAFLSRFPGLRLVGLDADGEILAKAAERLRPFGDRVQLFKENFEEFFRRYGERFQAPPDRILFDLGVSRFHYECSGRGFSFQRDEPLDMRLDPEAGEPASRLVNRLPLGELEGILSRYGEERLAGRIAARIVERRRQKPLASSRELAELIRETVPPAYRYGSIHPATRSFQALRIAVNGELDRLEPALKAAMSRLKIGGRIGVISFHSLEDRIVKKLFREGSRACRCPPEWPICQCGGRREMKLITKKPVIAPPLERQANPASRSAKLRVAERLGP